MCTPLADRSFAIRPRVASVSAQAHFLPDNACDESAASGRIVEEGTDAGPDGPVDAGVGCGLKVWE
jgi:hypothetical protein